MAGAMGTISMDMERPNIVILLVLCIGIPLSAPSSREDLARDKLQKWADI